MPDPELPLTGALAALAGVSAASLPAELARRVAAASAGGAAPGLPAIDLSHADAAALALIRERAGRALGTPWPQPLASDAARFHRDGDRVAWETPAFARQQRLTDAAVLAAATGDERWLAEVLDGATLLCEQSTWCWPAHDDARERHGSVLGVVTDPYVDLGAGEAAGQLAWLDHAVGARVEAAYPGFRARLRYEVRARVIEPFLARDWWRWVDFDGRVNNWNPWIHGNLLAAGLQFSGGDELARLLARIVAGLDVYVAALPADGAVDEGYAYWWNGPCRLLEALDLLAHATGLDAAREIPSLRETVAFPHRMHLGGDWYVNVADGQARPREAQPWHALHRAARRLGDPDAAAFAARHRAEAAVPPRDGLGRTLRGLADAEWAAAEGGDPLPRRTWLPSTQMMILRERAGSASGLAVAAKGGHNGENHNHNDVGSVIVASGGVPVIVDAGRPTYDARTFGPGRYEQWPMQSAWHSAPFVRGAGQPDGEAWAAEVVAAGGAELTLELAGAYDAPALETWLRTVAHEGDDGIRISDRWRFSGDASGSPTEIRFLIAGDVELAPGRARITPLAGAPAIELTWNEAALAVLTPRDLDDPMLSEIWGARLVRLDIDIAGLTALDVRVRQNERIGGTHS
ncbi:heparinase II/III domain-containing protein [Microbacterium halophytorum]|uniref:heparinase II/III domain-containing protein n=1 Tax=Microbacterium halophytorum TaxID=2067568 RepID=UPI001319E266|nr:heparinase II/III family protein [Microbacterium halophytorum]